ncbi:MAG: zinc ABC transporter ATP-binding protein ZnuC [Kiloniellaceae bacterium]
MPADSARAAQRDGETLVALSGLWVSLGGREVLKNVDLSVQRGEIVTLIGPNGAGKSTLVRVLLGLIDPGRGVVRRRAGLRVGYLPQKLAVDPVLPLTVKRFLALPQPRPAAARRAALEEVGAGHVIDRDVQDVSGGEFQRVLLARALLREPELLVLDEPLQGVDFGGQIELYDLIGRLRRRHGMGVLMVSHDLHVVMAATDHVVCLNRHVCCSGEPEAVSRQPEYAALFGPMARGLAVYSHEHDHEHDLEGNVVPASGQGGRKPAPRSGGAAG